MTNIKIFFLSFYEYVCVYVYIYKKILYKYREAIVICRATKLIVLYNFNGT